MTRHKSVEYHKKRRLERISKLKYDFGNDILQMVNEGKTIGEIVKCVKYPIKTVRSYLEAEKLYDTVQQNWYARRPQLAMENGKKSANTLKNVHLKPLTEEIKSWFSDQIQMGKFKWEIRNALMEKYGYGEKKYYQLCAEVGVPASKPLSGKYNPMYGRSPSKRAGIGIKGWVYIDGNKLFFRSSLELKIYLYLDSNNISFLQSLHRITYMDNGIEKTYCPDIVINDTICEIKPDSLTSNAQVVKKFNALENYCKQYNLKCKFITENTFPLEKLTKEDVNLLINQKKLVIDEKNYNKLMRYL